MLNLKARINELNANVATVFFAIKHPQTPRLAKILGTVTVVYALSPIDLIPDFIPIIGYLDDLILLPILISLTIKCIPLAIMAVARQQAMDFHKESHTKPIYALGVIGVYVVAITALFWIIL